MSAIKFIALLIAGLLLAPSAEANEPRLASGVTVPVSVVASRSPVKISTSTCRPVRYTVTPGVLPEGGSYDVTATLRDKHGRNIGSDGSSMEQGTAYRGSIYPRCGNKKFKSGRFTVAVTVVVNDAYFSPVETRVGSTTVRLRVKRPAPTTLMVTKAPYGASGWQWTGRLTSRGRPVPGQRIELWWNFFGWEDYDVSKRTDRNGTAHWVSNPNGALAGINFRLKFSGTKKYAASKSAVFNIAPR